MAASKLRLYHYWRSSCSWRVRWAFALKGIECELVPVDLVSGESESPEHLARNPLGFVPVLELPDAPPSSRLPRTLIESTAILEWAEETRPTPSILPADAYSRAWARQLAQMIVADTQPLQNPNVAALHSSNESERKKWMQHWIHHGLAAYETLVSRSTGKFSVGDSITIADLCLIPQCYNATRFEVPLTGFPNISRINEAALATEACKAASPDRHQPAPPG